VYKDFRSAVLDILGSQENQEALLNGVAGMGRGIDDIPGSIVSVDTAPSQNKIATAPPKDYEALTNVRNFYNNDVNNSLMGQNVTDSSLINSNSLLNSLPPIIWVIGGPGSNKATLCLKVVSINPGWGHFR
jgi:hypothetical protein